jgi:hypothetical protein
MSSRMRRGWCATRTRIRFMEMLQFDSADLSPEYLSTVK